jgi:hypothetical protein
MGGIWWELNEAIMELSKFDCDMKLPGLIPGDRASLKNANFVVKFYNGDYLHKDENEFLKDEISISLKPKSLKKLVELIGISGSSDLDKNIDKITLINFLYNADDISFSDEEEEESEEDKDEKKFQRLEETVNSLVLRDYEELEKEYPNFINLLINNDFDYFNKLSDEMVEKGCDDQDKTAFVLAVISKPDDFNELRKIAQLKQKNIPLIPKESKKVEDLNLTYVKKEKINMKKKILDYLVSNDEQISIANSDGMILKSIRDQIHELYNCYNFEITDKQADEKLIKLLNEESTIRQKRKTLLNKSIMKLRKFLFAAKKMKDQGNTLINEEILDKINNQIKKGTAIKNQFRQCSFKSIYDDLIIQKQKKADVSISKLDNLLNKSINELNDHKDDFEFIKDVKDELMALKREVMKVSKEEKNEIECLDRIRKEVADRTQNKIVEVDSKSIIYSKISDNSIVGYFGSRHKKLFETKSNLYKTMLECPMSQKTRMQLQQRLNNNKLNKIFSGKPNTKKSKIKIKRTKEQEKDGVSDNITKDELKNGQYIEDIKSVEEMVVDPKQLFKDNKIITSKSVIDDSFNDIELFDIERQIMNSMLSKQRILLIGEWKSRMILKCCMTWGCSNYYCKRRKIITPELPNTFQHLPVVFIDYMLIFLIGPHKKVNDVVFTALNNKDKLKKISNQVNPNFNLNEYNFEKNNNGPSLTPKEILKLDNYGEISTTKKEENKNSNKGKNKDKKLKKDSENRGNVIIENLSQHELETASIANQLINSPRVYDNIMRMGMEDFYMCDYFHYLTTDIQTHYNEIAFIQLRELYYEKWDDMIYECMTETELPKLTENDLKEFIELLNEYNMTYLKNLMLPYSKKFSEMFLSIPAEAYKKAKTQENYLRILFYYCLYLGTDYQAESIGKFYIGEKKSNFETFCYMYSDKLPNLDIAKIVVKRFSNLKNDKMEEIIRYPEKFNEYLKNETAIAKKLFEEENLEEKEEEEQEDIKDNPVDNKLNNDDVPKKNDEDLSDWNEYEEEDEDIRMIGGGEIIDLNDIKRKSTAINRIIERYRIYKYVKTIRKEIENKKVNATNQSARSDFYGEPLYSIIISMIPHMKDYVPSIVGTILDKDDEFIESLFLHKNKLINVLITYFSSLGKPVPNLSETDQYDIIAAYHNRIKNPNNQFSIVRQTNVNYEFKKKKEIINELNRKNVSDNFFDEDEDSSLEKKMESGNSDDGKNESVIVNIKTKDKIQTDNSTDSERKKGFNIKNEKRLKRNKNRKQKKKKVEVEPKIENKEEKEKNNKNLKSILESNSGQTANEKILFNNFDMKKVEHDTQVKKIEDEKTEGLIQQLVIDNSNQIEIETRYREDLNLAEKWNLLPKDEKKKRFRFKHFMKCIILENLRGQDLKQFEELKNEYLEYDRILACINFKEDYKGKNYNYYLYDSYGNATGREYWVKKRFAVYQKFKTLFQLRGLLFPEESNEYRVPVKNVLYRPFPNFMYDNLTKSEAEKQLDQNLFKTKQIKQIKYQQFENKKEEQVKEKEEIIKQIESKDDDIFKEEKKSPDIKKDVKILQEEVQKIKDKKEEVEIKYNKESYIDEVDYEKYKKFKEEMENYIKLLKEEDINNNLNNDYIADYNKFKVKYHELVKNRYKSTVIEEKGKKKYIGDTQIDEVLKYRIFLDRWSLTSSDHVYIKNKKSLILKDNKALQGIKLLPNFDGYKKMKVIFTLSNYPMFRLSSSNYLNSALMQVKARFGNFFDLYIMDENKRELFDHYLKEFNESTFRYFEDYMFHMHRMVCFNHNNLYDPFSQYYYYINTNRQNKELNLLSRQSSNPKAEILNKFRMILADYLFSEKMLDFEVIHYPQFVKFCLEKAEISHFFKFIPEIKTKEFNSQNSNKNNNNYRNFSRAKDDFIIVKNKNRKSGRAYNATSNSRRQYNYILRNTEDEIKSDDYYINLVLNPKVTAQKQITPKKYDYTNLKRRKRKPGLKGGQYDEENFEAAGGNIDYSLSTFQSFVRFYARELKQLDLKITNSYYVLYHGNIVTNFMSYRSYGLEKLLNAKLLGGSERIENIQPVTDTDNIPMTTNDINTNKNLQNLETEAIKKVEELNNEKKKILLEEKVKEDTKVKGIEVAIDKVLQGDNSQMKDVFKIFIRETNKYNDFGNLDVNVQKQVLYFLDKKMNSLPVREISDSNYSRKDDLTMLPNYTNIIFLRKFQGQTKIDEEGIDQDEFLNRYNLIDLLGSKYNDLINCNLVIPSIQNVRLMNYGADYNRQHSWQITESGFHWKLDTYTTAMQDPHFEKTPIFGTYLNDMKFVSRKGVETYLMRHTLETNYQFNNKLLSLMFTYVMRAGLFSWSMNWNGNVMKLLLYIQQLNLVKYITARNQHTAESIIYTDTLNRDYMADDDINVSFMTMGDFLEYSKSVNGLPQNVVYIPLESNRFNFHTSHIYLLSWLSYPRVYMSYETYCIRRRPNGAYWNRGRILNQSAYYDIPGQDNFVLLIMDDFSISPGDGTVTKQFLGTNLVSYRRSVTHPVVIQRPARAIFEHVDSAETMYRRFREWVEYYNVVFDTELIDIVGRMCFRPLSQLYIKCNYNNNPNFFETDDQDFVNINGLGWIPSNRDINYVHAVLRYANSFQHIAYYRGLICPTTMESYRLMQDNFDFFINQMDQSMFAAWYDYIRMIDKGTNTFYYYYYKSELNAYKTTNIKNLIDTAFNKGFPESIFIRQNTLWHTLDDNLEDERSDNLYLYHNYYDLLWFWNGVKLYDEKNDLPINVNEIPNKNPINADWAEISFYSGESFLESNRDDLVNKVFFRYLRNMRKPLILLECVSKTTMLPVNNVYLYQPSINLHWTTTTFQLNNIYEDQRICYLNNLVFWTSDAYLLHYLRLPNPTYFNRPKYLYKLTIRREGFQSCTGVYISDSKEKYFIDELTNAFSNITFDLDISNFQLKVGNSNVKENQNQ